ncbi:MAG: MgtC/SapB family protein [Comamonadaceae bacterium]|jgi:putative Mg2+ transporter-C (MgtC) family protein|uniref:Protein MgtC n=1 Tax=Hydrogenophaga borbori TaxID=2294117 RepID=A0A372EKD5_9BURK|nr:MULTISPECIES: MgtC/SapB family protein [Hydrogenophaga]NCT97823.1 MgtC/SapB family protein [Comamonadaceae bacterium]RFP79378.1 MgtC/SapB family protein [Hydrogenophaga borbori]WQB84400.1 MgtC/SapB family protein [Hydrogenophaga sp. SNF1]
MDPLNLPDPETLALYKEIARHLLFAMVAGGLIGLERSFHGRPAGFRTHTLVCLASSLLMLVTLYQGVWFEQNSKGNVTMDPTRMAQGIMTGIGFLGAGVIFKEGLTVRGLTTAASIWITASIGVLMGIGFYFPAVLATVLTLATLVLLHRVERVVPTHIYAQLMVRFDRLKAMPEADLRQLLKAHGFTIANLSYRLEEGDAFEYRMMLRTRRAKNLGALARTLGTQKVVEQFRLSPTGD